MRCFRQWCLPGLPWTSTNIRLWNYGLWFWAVTYEFENNTSWLVYWQYRVWDIKFLQKQPDMSCATVLDQATNALMSTCHTHGIQNTHPLRKDVTLPFMPPHYFIPWRCPLKLHLSAAKSSEKAKFGGMKLLRQNARRGCRKFLFWTEVFLEQNEFARSREERMGDVFFGGCFFPIFPQRRSSMAWR